MVTKLQSLIIGLGIVAVFLLYQIRGKDFAPGLLSVILIVAIGFVFPYVSLILLIPIIYLQYAQSYQSLGEFWRKVTDIKFEEVKE